MGDWRQSGSLLSPTSGVRGRISPHHSISTSPAVQPRLLMAGGICALCLLAGLGVYAFRPQPGREHFGKQSGSSRARDENETERDMSLRKEAIADLHAKIEKLPDKPSSGSNIFYYGFHLSLVDTSSALAPWIATMSGVEDVVDPETQQPLWRTDFVLEADYRGGWTFRHYRGRDHEPERWNK